MNVGLTTALNDISPVFSYVTSVKIWSFSQGLQSEDSVSCVVWGV